jgi:hypothetical protein
LLGNPEAQYARYFIAEIPYPRFEERAEAV